MVKNGRMWYNVRKENTRRTGGRRAVLDELLLGLDIPRTQERIGKVGYTLTHSNKFVSIIAYFIRQGICGFLCISERCSVLVSR